MIPILSNKHDEMDRIYPDRHSTIHKVACQHCPSTKGQDPEAADIKANCTKHEIATRFLFPCGWRGSRLCKGYCDYNGIDQQYLDSLKENIITQP